MKSIVIIGNGIAGTTAARHIRKLSDAKITLISKESGYFFSRTALMYVYMGHMRFKDTEPYEPEFWTKNRIDLVRNEVATINPQNKSISLATGEELHYDELIIASGSRPAFYNWPGQDLIGVQGMYSKQDLESLEKLSPSIKSAVVVGGGLIGIELVEMLLSRGVHVHFLIRDKHFWGNIIPENDSLLISSHMKKHHGLTLHFETELVEIIGEGQVNSIKTGDGQTITCQFVGITTGVMANKELAASSGIETNRGILVNQFLQTSIPSIYAIGDCSEQREPQLGRSKMEPVWYTGRMMGETVAQNICGNPTIYNPGNWFNSAKFFDIEYQTYGHVPSQKTDGISLFEWQHPSKELRLTFAYATDTQQFIGVNTFGIRLRHELFDQWLSAKISLAEVIKDLRTANFDPEFYRSFEVNILEKYNNEFGTHLELNRKTWWQNLLQKSV